MRTAYRYLEAAHALRVDGSTAAFTLLTPETTAPNLLWLSLAGALQQCSQWLFGPATGPVEFLLLGVSMLVWGAYLIGIAAITGRTFQAPDRSGSSTASTDSWALLCGALILSNGSLLWAATRGDDLVVLALLVPALLFAFLASSVWRRILLPGLVLLSALAGPEGIGLALGSVCAHWVLERDLRARLLTLLSALTGIGIYAVAVAVAAPLAPYGLGASLTASAHDAIGELLRGGWSMRMEQNWRSLASLGSPASPLGFLPGVVLLLGLAVLAVPGRDTPEVDRQRSHTLGTAIGFMTVALLFSAAFSERASARIVALALPLVTPALVVALHRLWISTPSLGPVPAGALLLAFLVSQWMDYPRWAEETRRMMTRQAQVASAVAQELELEPAAQVALPDIPVARWRLRESGRLAVPARWSPGTSKAGTVPYLEPQWEPWRSRRSPLAPPYTPPPSAESVTLPSQPPLVRWAGARLEPLTGFPPLTDAPIVNPAPLWLPKRTLDGIEKRRGIALHLEPWWRIPPVAGSRAPAWTEEILSTETLGSGQGFAWARSEPFEIQKDLMLVRAGFSHPDPDCSIRLLVWDNAQSPCAQDADVLECRHIDLTEPGVHLRSRLFAYDDPEMLIPLQPSGCEGWRVVKIWRGDDPVDFGTPARGEMLWDLRPWAGRRACWSLSDRSQTASVVLEGILHGEDPAVRTWDFESGSYQNWRIIGDAFAAHPAVGHFPGQQKILGQRGGYFLNSDLHGSDTPRGVLESEPFVLDGDLLGLHIGGGDDARRVGVELLVDGQTALTATGDRDETLRLKVWDVARYRGRPAQLRVFDLSSEPWGHILVDDIRLWRREDAPTTARDALTPGANPTS